MSVTERILLGDAGCDQCSHILKKRRRLEVYCSDPSPIEDLIGQSVLQISKTRGIGSALKLRHIHNQFCSSAAGGGRKDRCGLQKPLSNRIGEVRRA
jgi:hypothetical protein